MFGGGLILTGVVGAVLLVTVAVMGLLSYLAWPSVAVPLRVARLVIPGCGVVVSWPISGSWVKPYSWVQAADSQSIN